MAGIYKQGVVLESKRRTKSASLIVMVLEDIAYRLTSTEDQFSAVVIRDDVGVYKVGYIANNWNKGSWSLYNAK